MRPHRHERGSVSTWLALAAAAMILCVGLAVDLGGHVHAQQRVRDLAAQAVRTAGEEIAAAPAVRGEMPSVDAVAARAAARRYLERAGVTGTVHLTAGTTLTVTGQATARLVRAVDGTER